MKTNSKHSAIFPDALYPLAAFREVAGVSETRMRLARKDGIELPALKVGRRKFIKGADAIDYLERLAGRGEGSLN